MNLSFEKFTRLGGSFSPFVSIRKNGAIGISQGALQQFKLLDGQFYVVLYYDRHANVVGIEPTRDANAEGAIKLVTRKSTQRGGYESISSSIAARSFLNYYGIAFGETMSFAAEWSEEHKMILFDLNNPREKRRQKSGNNPEIPEDLPELPQIENDERE